MNEATLLQQPSGGQMHHAKAEVQTSKTTKSIEVKAWDQSSDPKT